MMRTGTLSRELGSVAFAVSATSAFTRFPSSRDVHEVCIQAGGPCGSASRMCGMEKSGRAR